MENLDWLITKTEQCSNRYIDAECFLIKLMEMPWYNRFLLRYKISVFLKSQLNKYKF